jgi:hypothetical protein
VLLTRPPLTEQKQASVRSARLACIRHAASVRPEPGSNSPKRKLIGLFNSALTPKVSSRLRFSLWTLRFVQFSRSIP